MKKLMMIAAALSALAASAEISITDVTARQRWPWNGLVDIDFTISGAAAGEAFAIDIDASAASGATQLSAKTYVTEPIGGSGDNRIVWDLGADYPNFRANDVRISVTATPISSDTPIYMVIDLSGGATATKYPVRYTTQAPAHVQGAANEPCQTTELWMRRIVVPDFAFTVNKYSVNAGSTSGNEFYARLTKDYYIGIFELTQKQYQLVTGNWPTSYFTNMLYRASRPLEAMRWQTLTGTLDDTQSSPSSITADSFFGKIRSKTGLPINVPTSTQLAFAIRGGTRLQSTSEFYYYSVNGTIPSDRSTYYRNKGTVENTSPQRDSDANSGTAFVGSYPPNDYGLYDTVGNVYEFTSEYRASSEYKSYYKTRFDDPTIGLSKGNPVVDPPGVLLSEASDASGVIRLVRGGCYTSTALGISIWHFDNVNSSYSEGGQDLSRVGFRLSFTCD